MSVSDMHAALMVVAKRKKAKCIMQGESRERAEREQRESRERAERESRERKCTRQAQYKQQQQQKFYPEEILTIDL